MSLLGRYERAVLMMVSQSSPCRQVPNPSEEGRKKGELSCRGVGNIERFACNDHQSWELAMKGLATEVVTSHQRLTANIDAVAKTKLNDGVAEIGAARFRRLQRLSDV
eukprot:scaffold11835_cov34-Prasinocladus_malaysianus.AAC.4